MKIILAILIFIFGVQIVDNQGKIIEKLEEIKIQNTLLIEEQLWKK